MQKLPLSLRILCEKEWHVCSLESPVQVNGQLPRLEMENGWSSAAVLLPDSPGLYNRQPSRCSCQTFTASLGMMIWSAHGCPGVDLSLAMQADVCMSPAQR